MSRTFSDENLVTNYEHDIQNFIGSEAGLVLK